MNKSQRVRLQAIHTAVEDILKADVTAGCRQPEKEVILKLIESLCLIERMTGEILDETK